MIYITGDTHREFNRLNGLDIKKNDMLIILGDSCINYYLNKEDERLKRYLNSFKYKFFIVRGNHEERPENISTYKEVDMFGGKVYMESAFKNLIFAKDGEVYNIDDKKVLVLGGAYSVDKYYRILYRYEWFKDEQLNDTEKKNILEKVKGKHFDVVLSHTSPLKYEATEAFVLNIDQSTVDKSMEEFLDKVEESIDYDKWYCGHYHIEKQIDKMEFMFESTKEFCKDKVLVRKRRFF